LIVIDAQKSKGTARDFHLLTSIFGRALLSVLHRGSLLSASALPDVPRRLLAVKVHGLGDSVMVRSLLENFHQRHPYAEIGVLAGPANRELLTVGSRFQLHLYDQRSSSLGTILRILAGIRSRRYQAVVNFEQGSLVGTAFIRVAGIPVHAGFVPLNDGAKAILLTHPVRFREEDSMWASFIRLIRMIDREFPEAMSTTPLPVDQETRRWVQEWLCDKTRGTISHSVALHLGSAQKRPYKRWPVERFIALAERLRMRTPDLLVVLTGQPFERPLVEEFTAGYVGPVADATELGSIVKIAALLAECDLLVSNDTGIMHLGAAMHAPTVGIFGPVSPQRWAPVGPYVEALAADGISCSPCAETYRLCDPPDCFNPERMRCLHEVSVEMVLKAAERVTAERRQQQRSNRQLARSIEG
jgi:ADP-heptose:LPS heptosyltransferase